MSETDFLVCPNFKGLKQDKGWDIYVMAVLMHSIPDIILK